ncbi:MAG: O-antigen ligase family protein, partial [Solirubrobacteraceae bacterium]
MIQRSPGTIQGRRTGARTAQPPLFTQHPRLVFTMVAVVFTAALLPLLRNPTYSFVLAAAVIGAAIAWRSTVIPLALAGVPPLIDAIVGYNPLPKGGFTFVFSLWIAVSLACVAMRGRLGDIPRALLSVGVLASFALLGLMLMRLSISPDETYGSQKVQLFIADVLILFVAAVFVGAAESGPRRFFSVLFALNALGAIVFLLNLVSGGAHLTFNGRFSLARQEYPIDLGRASADGLLLALYFVISATQRNVRLLGIVLAPVLAVALAAAGSRGPVVAFAIGLLALLTLTAVNPRARRRLGIVAFVFLLAAVIVPLVVPGSALGRALSTIIGSASGLSSNGRSQLWSVSIATFSQHPLLGLG